MRIAIVGAGISGLTAAHLLAARHQVTVFEAAATPGGHAHAVPVKDGHRTLMLDTGFLVFNDHNYPNFERLLNQIGVAWQPSDMSFSVSDGAGFEYSSRSLNGLFADRRRSLSPDFLRMLTDVPRFQRAARALLAQPGPDSRSLLRWLADERFSEQFVQRLIVPQVAAVWSADPQQLWSMPAEFLLQFFANHGMLELRDRPRWRTIRGSSHVYVQAITRRFRDQLRCGSPVQAISRTPEQVLVQVRDQAPEQFDQVVIATHSDQALALLSDASERERELLGAIRYQPNEAILHTDVRLLPANRRAWASWNYRLGSSSQDEQRVATVTYHLNRLQSLRSETQYCVSLNLGQQIDPRSVIARMRYAHPIFTAQALAAQARHEEISGQHRTHFCGAYWGWGFHEDGVRSGLRVAERFGAKL